jgi:hypothetical protein
MCSIVVFPTTATSSTSPFSPFDRFEAAGDQEVDFIDEELLKDREAVSVLVGEGDPADDVLAEAPLRVRGRGRGEDFSGVEIAQIRGDGGGPDIEREPEGTGAVPVQDGGDALESDATRA